ncbi:hypothetical protein M2401_002900 [Pseudomonas sp. JUb42]|jgi:hypothetical protein|uniref:hypothetical protein n=1 Tax=Pseudomonas sp. JUb42 TaxID=2940611 RepID=UPI002167DD11|nr:hypothetical protein [Pseudomonas sp. JUb42]MCS3469162.1 hypothetical protein [Pseudomonas sp. JUb42]
MTVNNLQDRYTPLSHPGLDSPVLMLDTQASLKDLHACTVLRVNLVTRFLDTLANLKCTGADEHDLVALAGTAHMLMQETCDVNRAIEARLWRGAQARL